MVRLVVLLVDAFREGHGASSFHKEEQRKKHPVTAFANNKIFAYLTAPIFLYGAFSVRHGMLRVVAAEMARSHVPELLPLLLPGHWPCCRASLLSPFSWVIFPPTFIFKYIFFFSLLVFCFVCNINRYIWLRFGSCSSRLEERCDQLCAQLVPAGQPGVGVAAVSCHPLPPLGVTRDKDAGCTFPKFLRGQKGRIWHKAAQP